MNKIRLKTIIAFVVVLFISCSDQEVDVVIVDNPDIDEPEDGQPDQEGWVLVFEENFDDESLPEWDLWNGGAFNNEIQFYRPSQLTVEDGILSINVERQAITGPTTPFDNAPKDFEYVSGRIESKQYFGPSNSDGEQEYRFVARLNLPVGNGMWPAFWTLGDNWPTQGEIDILEARGNEPMNFSSNIFYGVEPGVPLTMDVNTSTTHTVSTDITAGFHDYELIWSENSLDILFDGNLIKHYDASPVNFINELFGKQHRVVINSAVGGLFFPPNADSQTFADNAVMQADWVRVYKR